MTTWPQDLKHPLDTLRHFLAARGVRIEMTERAKALVAVLGGVLILSVWIGVAGLADSGEQRLKRAQADLALLQNQVEFGSWADRKKQSLAVKVNLESRYWTAQTPGLAEASFERWIRTHLTRAKSEPQQILIQRSVVSGSDLDPAASDTAAMQRMTAKVLMPFQPTALLAFLETAAENNRIAMVDRLIIRTGRGARVEMDISTVIRLSSAAEEEATP